MSQKFVVSPTGTEVEQDFQDRIPLQNPKPLLEDTVRLRRNQLCPIHRSLACCGRESARNERRTRQMGVRRIDDPQHPRGYREIRSNAEMRKLMDRKIASQNSICALCKEQFTDYSDIVPDHINPRGMGGSVEGRSSRQHSSGSLVVQRRKRLEQGITTIRLCLYQPRWLPPQSWCPRRLCSIPYQSGGTKCLLTIMVRVRSVPRSSLRSNSDLGIGTPWICICCGKLSRQHAKKTSLSFVRSIRSVTSTEGI